jgi:hypothetical protein
MHRIVMVFLLAMPWDASAQFGPRNCDPDAGLVDASCLTDPPPSPQTTISKKPLPVTKISGSLQAAIKRLSPTARVLQASEIDMRECEPVPKAPGLVKADFNGDGFEDAAALLVTHISDKVTLWDGREFRDADFLLVLFLGDGKGGFQSHVVSKFPDQIPTAVVLSITGPGIIFSLENSTNRTALKNPAFVEHYCGKSSAAYEVTGDRIREIILSD